MAVVEQPEITWLLAWVAVGGRGAVAVDQVAIQVERDAVGADHDAVIRTVDEVLLEGRVQGRCNDEARRAPRSPLTWSTRPLALILSARSVVWANVSRRRYSPALIQSNRCERKRACYATPHVLLRHRPPRIPPSHRA